MRVFFTVKLQFLGREVVSCFLVAVCLLACFYCNVSILWAGGGQLLFVVCSLFVVVCVFTIKF